MYNKFIIKFIIKKYVYQQIEISALVMVIKT